MPTGAFSSTWRGSDGTSLSRAHAYWNHLSSDEENRFVFMSQNIRQPVLMQHSSKGPSVLRVEEMWCGLKCTKSFVMATVYLEWFLCDAEVHTQKINQFCFHSCHGVLSWNINLFCDFAKNTASNGIGSIPNSREFHDIFGTLRLIHRWLNASVVNTLVLLSELNHLLLKCTLKLQSLLVSAGPGL